MLDSCTYLPLPGHGHDHVRGSRTRQDPFLSIRDDVLRTKKATALVDNGGLGREWTAARLALVAKVHVGGHRHRNLWIVGVPQGDGHLGVGEGGEHSSMNRPLTWA